MLLPLTTLWGGVHPAVLLCGFAVTAASLLSVGCFSILCSVQSPSVFGAVLSSYAILVVFTLPCLACAGGFLSSPIAFIAELDSRLTAPAATTSGPAAPVNPWTAAVGMTRWVICWRRCGAWGF